MKLVSTWDGDLPCIRDLVGAERFAADVARGRDAELLHVVALLVLQQARRMPIERLGFDALAARCLAELRRPPLDPGELLAAVADFLCWACRTRVLDGAEA